LSAAGEELEALLALMRTLRDPDTGCAWDRQQTFVSIAPFTIEEAYEVADAIGRGDLARLRDELGDLLFQVVFHARMAEEAGSFDFASLGNAESARARGRGHAWGAVGCSTGVAGAGARRQARAPSAPRRL
jgi:ATP diphosphatase